MPKLNQKGIGLVEVIAALGISIIVITSLVSLTVFTLRSSQRSKQLLESSRQANKTLELVRALRDSTDWQNGTDGFIDQLMGACSDVCRINNSLVLAADSNPFDDPNYPLTLDPAVIDVFFTVADPTDGGSVDDSSTVVRVSVFAVTRVGDQAKTTSLYTDLTSWRDK